MTNPVSGGFQLTPATGLNDTSTYPTTPVNETTARQQFMDMYWQLMNEMNKPTLSASAYAQYNKLINGNFDIWQRGTNFTATGSSLYTSDRWTTFNNITNQAATISRQDGTGVTGSVYCLRYQRNAGQTGTNVMLSAQSMESGESKKIVGNKLTLSFWARAGSGSSLSALATTVFSGTGTDQNVIAGFTGSAVEANQIFALGTTWQKYTLTTTNAISNSKTQLGIQFGVTPSGTAGANDYYEITQVQVNVGDQALPYQPKSFAEELALCQRYYEKSYSTGVSPGSVDVNGESIFKAELTSAILGSVSFAVVKRVTPTVTIYNPQNGTAAKVSQWSSGSQVGNTVTAGTIGSSGFPRVNDSSTAFTVGVAYEFHWAADAEI